MAGPVHFSEAANLAVHALAFLAGREPGVLASAPVVAGALGVSEAHLSKVLQQLTRHGILVSSRGAKGGFSLDRDPGAVTLLEIVELFDGPLTPKGCLLGSPICSQSGCVLQEMYDDVLGRIREHLGGTRLSDMRSQLAGGDDHADDA